MNLSILDNIEFICLGLIPSLCVKHIDSYSLDLKLSYNSVLG